jgi:nucleoside phosphorylase
MPAEAYAIFGRRSWVPVKATQSAFVFRYINPNCLVVQSGVGLARADEAARWLLNQGVTALISLGVSGGLSEGIVSGDLVLGVSLTSDGQVWAADVGWAEKCLAKLESAAMAAQCGGLVSVQQAVLNPEAKRNLAKVSGAIAVDMESAAVAQVAVLAKLPFLALRAVCDTVSQKVAFDPSHILTSDGRVLAVRLIMEIIRRPALLLELPRIGKDFDLSLTALRRGWDALEKSCNIYR